MTAIEQALERMRAAARAPMGGNAAVLEHREELLGRLHETVEALEATAPTDRRPSRSTLEEARRAWRHLGRSIDQLTTRQIRALCWDAETAMEPDFIRAIASHEELAQNRRWIEGLIENYFVHWRRMAAPDAVEELLRRAVANFRGRSHRIAMSRRVAPRLFSPTAPQWLAKQVVGDRRPVDEVLKEWRVDPSTGLGQAVAEAAVVVWTHRFLEKKQVLVGNAAYAWYEQLTQQLLSSSLVGSKPVADAMSAVILWDQAEANQQIHDELRAFLLDDPRFGDPRSPKPQAVWDLCEAAARQRAIGWLAKCDLIFFFNFVILNDPHGRRDFWLQYINNAVDAQVALANQDVYRLHAAVRDRPRYSKVTSGSTSAFLMRFRGRGSDIICIEFSNPGNAVYIHDAAAFLDRHKSIRLPRFDLSRQLKDKKTRLKHVWHRSNWEWELRNVLAQYGVRPA